MKNSKIWYLGYVLGFCSLVLVLALKLNEVLKIFLTFIFAMSISVSYVNIMHNKMIKNDKSYKIDVNDERNEKIRDKVNAMMASILLLIIGIVAVICISIKAYLPAVLLIISIVCSPVIMFFITKYYEKKY